MFFQKSLLAYLVSFMAVALFGCGEKTVTATSESRAESSGSCLGCHASSLSPVTGKVVADEWKASSHNLKNGAGCADCHEADAGHPSSCNLCHGGTPTGSSATSVTHNPDKAGKCAKCHTKNAGFSSSLRAHFNNITTGVYPASYVSSKYEKNCRACHNPHDTKKDLAVLQDWAKSGHGRTNGPWIEYDFKLPFFGDPTSFCSRCHTTTGFIKYVTTGDSRPWGVPSDKTKEMLVCNGCHTDYTYKLRALPAFIAPYNDGNNPATYPDAKSSNLCINCHSGHESGDSVKAIADFSNVTFVDTHYLAAAGVVFAKNGYHFSDSSGARNYSPDPSEDVHFKLGMGVVTGKAGFDAIRGNYTGGPCVTCHLTSVNGSHTLKAVTVYSTSDTSLNPVCGTTDCHSKRVPTSVNPISPNSSPNSYITWLGDRATSNTLTGTTNKAQYQAALAALNAQLTARGFVYDDDSHPVFANTNWGNANNMGAAFNYRMLFKDRGGVAHNRRYTKRLIYDSIDWLDDKKMNNSVYATLNALPVTAVYKASAISYLINRGDADINIGTPAERF
jgi:hypothetical protein